LKEFKIAGLKPDFYECKSKAKAPGLKPGRYRVNGPAATAYEGDEAAATAGVWISA
jgi:hypothetical protein